MKIRTLLEANEPLKRLCEKRLASYKKMRELVKLRKSIQEEIDFYTEQERKSINTYASLDEKGAPLFLDDGRLRLRDEAAKVAFEAEIDELRNTETDITTCTLCESDFLSPADLPTPNEMYLLEGIINFED